MRVRMMTIVPDDRSAREIDAYGERLDDFPDGIMAGAFGDNVVADGPTSGSARSNGRRTTEEELLDLRLQVGGRYDHR